MAQIVPISAALSALPAAADHYLTANHPRTSKTYHAKARDLELFVAFCTRDFAVRHLGDLTRAMIEQFIAWRLSEQDGPATIARRLATIRHFCREIERGCVPGVHAPHFLDPTAHVRPPRITQPQPKWLTSEQVESICAQEFGANAFRRTRNRLAINLLFYCGLRSQELRYIKGSQISDDARWLLNVQRKGQRWMDIPIPKHVVPLVSAYSYQRFLFLKPQIPDWDEPDRPWNNFPLIVSGCRGKWKNPESWRMCAKTLWNIVSEAAKLAGIPHVHPHQLRHSFCHELATRGVEPRIIQQLAGHADINMTMRYVTPSEKEKLEAVEKL